MPSDYPFFKQPGRALLTIDDADDQAIVDEGFRLRGWQVAVEHDLSRVIEELLQDRADVLITDDMELVELVTKAFAIDTPDGPSKEGPPVFYIGTTEEDYAEGFRIGADMVVLHPVSVEELFQFEGGGD
jgi:DNA-binding response OmpR family regulator